MLFTVVVVLLTWVSGGWMMTVEAQSTTLCGLNCEVVDPALLVYCKGVVDYPTCVSQKDGTPQAADARAQSQAANTLVQSNCPNCQQAKKNMLCSLLFPKCDPSAGPPIAQPLCTNTCEDFFTQCVVSLTTQCQFTGGQAPSVNCTGTVPLPPPPVVPTAAPASDSVKVTVVVSFAPSSAQVTAVINILASISGLPASSFTINGATTLSVTIAGTNAGSSSTKIVRELSCNSQYFMESDPSLPRITSATLSSSGATLLTTSFGLLLALAVCSLLL